MSPLQFYNLDEHEQAEKVWEGKVISTRQDGIHDILLYRIGELFVEAYYHKEYNILRKFIAYNEHELLDFYLPKN